MSLNAVWLLIFGQDNKYCFALSSVDIVFLYITGMIILRQADRAHLAGHIELIFLRGAFSIYMGWVTAATILNIAFALKSWGMSGDYEVKVSVAILVVAEVIYCLFSFVENNPLFGAVYIWVLFAIKDFENMHAPIVSTINILLPVHAVALAVITYTSRKPKTHGLFF